MKRAGFTLLEVLIVVLVLTTLMVMFSFSSSAMKATARTNQIIADMYAWKQGALAWLHEHNDEIDPSNPTFLKHGTVNGDDLLYDSQEFRLEVAKYLDNAGRGIDISSKQNIFKIKCDKNKRWFVCYDLPADPTLIRQLMTKLGERAAKFGLLKNIDKRQPFDGKQSWIYLLIADFNN